MKTFTKSLLISLIVVSSYFLLLAFYVAYNCASSTSQTENITPIEDFGTTNKISMGNYVSVSVIRSTWHGKIQIKNCEGFSYSNTDFLVPVITSINNIDLVTIHIIFIIFVVAINIFIYLTKFNNGGKNE